MDHRVHITTYLWSKTGSADQDICAIFYWFYFDYKNQISKHGSDPVDIGWQQMDFEHVQIFVYLTSLGILHDMKYLA